MEKTELQNELDAAMEILKDHRKFIDLFREEDDPKGILARLYKTLSTINALFKAQNIKSVKHPEDKVLISRDVGVVKVRPCKEEYKDKTYIGIMIGELATNSGFQVTDDSIQLLWGVHNPAIYVPELNKLIFGYESWWSKITDMNEIKDITDKDIDDVWYVQLLKAQIEKQAKEEKDLNDEVAKEFP